jgi:hypothetical protein
MEALALAPRLGSNVAGLVGEQFKHIHAATVLQAYARRWLVPRVFTSRWRRHVCKRYVGDWGSVQLWYHHGWFNDEEGLCWSFGERGDDITGWSWLEDPDFDEEERSVRADAIVAKAIACAVDHEDQYWRECWDEYWEEHQDDHEANA